MTLKETDFQRKPAQKQFRVTRNSKTATAVRKAFWVKVDFKWKFKFKPVVILYKVWTHESYHKLVKYDCPGECGPEKECLWWHWLTFWQPERIHHQGQARGLWWCQCQSMSLQTVLLRSTLPQMIILHGLMVIISKKTCSETISCYTKFINSNRGAKGLLGEGGP